MADPAAGRAPSLRTRVALAAVASTVIVAVVVAATVAALLARREVTALDRRLDAVSRVVVARLSAGADPVTLLDAARRGGLLQAGVGGLVVTVRGPDGAAATTSLAAEAPDLPARTGTVSVGGIRYRVHTTPLPDAGTVTVGLPATATERTVVLVWRFTLLGTLLAALAAGGLAWLLAGPATRPLRTLRDRTAALPASPDPAARAALRAGPVARSAETADLAGALGGLLERVERSRAEGERALLSARDFAAAAEHELRTPLTTMRTDLDVLEGHADLPVDQRREILAQLRGTQERIEATLAALAQLARGELAAPGDRAPVDVTDLVASAVGAAARSAPGGPAVQARLPEQDVWSVGSASGLRLAVDNLLANAVRHSRGSRVEASVSCTGDRIQIAVDDDGIGVPPEERAQVFARFRRGRAASSAGSGLGLALVAQQAALHGGRTWLTDSPLGGTRAVLELPGGVPSSPR